MTTLTPQRIADLKAIIAKKYGIDQLYDGFWVVVDNSLRPINDNDHFEELDAEAEMEAIIQDEVKAAMEEME
jgi:hypothetical protein